MIERRLLVVALTGLGLGSVVGAVWMSQDLPAVEPVATVASRPERPARDAVERSKAGEATRPATTRPQVPARPPRDGAMGPAEGRGEPGRGPGPAGPGGEGSEPGGRPRRPDGGQDTGLHPSPATVLGLPRADADASTLVAQIAEEMPPLPERPLSHFEMEALEDRAAWLAESCQASGDARCALAMENINQAVEQARRTRQEAGVDGDEDVPPPPPDEIDEADLPEGMAKPPPSSSGPRPPPRSGSASPPPR